MAEEPWGWWLPLLGAVTALMVVPAIVIWEMMQPDTPGGGGPGEGNPHTKGNPRNKEEAMRGIK